MGITAGKLHIGVGSITFGTGALLYAGGIIVRETSTVVEAPDIEGAGAPLDIRVTNRRLAFYVKDPSLTVETIAHAFGISSSRVNDSIANKRILTPVASDTSVDTGSASLALTRDDGKQVRFYMPKAAIVPTNEEIPVGKGQFFVASYAIQCIDDGTGSLIPYRVEESTV